MAERRIGLIMNGVTGRMGMNQHLIRSIAAIRKDGGVPLANGDRVMPDPILVGRNRDKLEALAKAHGIARVSTDLDACLADPKDEVFFDAATTQMRAALSNDQLWRRLCTRAWAPGWLAPRLKRLLAYRTWRACAQGLALFLSLVFLLRRACHPASTFWICRYCSKYEVLALSQLCQ